tara:strand:- start:423 stop:590 length:168 start_codon:yes stop_codon:yes gene_type:complete
MFIFISLVIYISFLIYTDGDLPGESEKIINPMMDEAGKLIKDLSNHLQDLSNTEK